MGKPPLIVRCVGLVPIAALLVVASPLLLVFWVCGCVSQTAAWLGWPADDGYDGCTM